MVLIKRIILAAAMSMVSEGAIAGVMPAQTSHSLHPPAAYRLCRKPATPPTTAAMIATSNGRAFIPTNATRMASTKPPMNPMAAY